MNTLSFKLSVYSFKVWLTTIVIAPVFAAVIIIYGQPEHITTVARLLLPFYYLIYLVITVLYSLVPLFIFNLGSDYIYGRVKNSLQLKLALFAFAELLTIIIVWLWPLKLELEPGQLRVWDWSYIVSIGFTTVLYNVKPIKSTLIKRKQIVVFSPVNQILSYSLKIWMTALIAGVILSLITVNSLSVLLFLRICLESISYGIPGVVVLTMAVQYVAQLKTDLRVKKLALILAADMLMFLLIWMMIKWFNDGDLAVQRIIAIFITYGVAGALCIWFYKPTGLLRKGPARFA